MVEEIRRVDHNTFDVFSGTQWGTWTRVRKGRNSTYILAGEKIGYADLKHLHDILDPRMPINYGQPHEVTLENCEKLAAAHM